MKEKPTSYIQGTPKRLSAFQKKLQARREWPDIFKVMNEKNLEPRILYPARLSFRFEAETDFYRPAKPK